MRFCHEIYKSYTYIYVTSNRYLLSTNFCSW
nr:MAG TPA: hypothetical protein [Caudoviricetes sp.]